MSTSHWPALTRNASSPRLLLIVLVVNMRIVHWAVQWMSSSWRGLDLVVELDFFQEIQDGRGPSFGEEFLDALCCVVFVSCWLEVSALYQDMLDGEW